MSDIDDMYRAYIDAVYKYLNGCRYMGFKINDFDEDYFIETCNFIINNLLVMARDKDKRFIDTLVDVIDKNALCVAVKPDMSHFIKLYMVIQTYLNNDIDNYMAILEDVKNFENYENVYHFSSKFMSNRSVIDSFTGNKFYKDLPNLRKIFIKLFNYFNWSSSNTFDFNAINNQVLKVMEDGFSMKIDDSKIASIANKVLGEEFVMFTHSTPYLYSSILLIGDRFEYINDKLIEIERNYFVRKSIFSYISDLNMDMFDVMNTSSKNDSFITYMDIVFDSDSYLELVNKLSILREASSYYGDGFKEEAIDMLRSLNDSSNKKVYCGGVVSFPTNSVNKIEKPKTILAREINLYKKINDSISYDFMLGIHYHALDVDKLCENIDSVLVDKMSPTNTFKRKIKLKMDVIKRRFVNAKK